MRFLTPPYQLLPSARPENKSGQVSGVRAGSGIPDLCSLTRVLLGDLSVIEGQINGPWSDELVDAARQQVTEEAKVRKGVKPTRIQCEYHRQLLYCSNYEFVTPGSIDVPC